jgi:hypothetical protein
MREQNHGGDEDPRYRHSPAEAVEKMLRYGNNPDFGVASPAQSFAAETADTGQSLKAISPLSCLVRPLHSV